MMKFWPKDKQDVVVSPTGVTHMTIQELQGLAEEYTLAPTPKLLEAIQKGLEVVEMSHHAEQTIYEQIKKLVTPEPKSRAFPYDKTEDFDDCA